MTAYGLGYQYMAEVIMEDAARRLRDPLSYDKATLKHMAETLDEEIEQRLAKIEEIKNRVEKREALAGKKSLGAIFKKVAHDINYSGNYSAKNRLQSASVFTSAGVTVVPALATSMEKLETLKETDEYKNLVEAARRNNVYITFMKHAYGASIDIDVTKASDGSPKQAPARPASSNQRRKTPAAI